jgi:general secretion pathway protein J
LCNTLRNKGFTLLELLVAMVLLAILSTALYGTFFTLTKGRDSAMSGMEYRRELRTTLDQLRREIDATFYNQDNKRLHFVVEDRDFFGKPASTLDFTTISPPRGEGAAVSDQVAVTYRNVAKENRMLLAREAHDPYYTVEPVPYPQMEELEGFLVECYDGSKWVKSWDTALNKNLPKLVRVTVTVREGERTVAFTTLATPRIGGM